MLYWQAEHSDSDVDWNTDDEIDNYDSSFHDDSMSETWIQTNVAHVGISDETVAKFIDMGFSAEMIGRAIEEIGGENPDHMVILETLIKHSRNSEASSSKSTVIDYLIGMGFSEDLVIKFVQEYGEENVDEITNALLSYAEAKKLSEAQDEDINNGLSSLDEEMELNSSHEDGRLQTLIKMGYPREEASTAIEICDSAGEKASVGEVIDFILAARMARQFDESYVKPDEEKPITNTKKRRSVNDQPRRSMPNTTMCGDEVRLPNPMIGFGVPNQPGLMTQRPEPIPDIARGPPYFYYENVAMAPKGVWTTISRHLYGIKPEFVDSMYFCAAARKRGYIHNLPIHNRFAIEPRQPYTIQEAFPLCKKWWPTWDKRTKLNCLRTGISGSAKVTYKIRSDLEEHDGDLKVQKSVVDQCRKFNLVWVGKYRVAPLEPVEIEMLLGFPKYHTRGGVSFTDRYTSLGNSFQVDTVAYHLSVLKPLFPNGIKVLSLFTGIGGGEVALHRLGIPMKLVVSVEISKVNRDILRSFWANTRQHGVLREFIDIEELRHSMIEKLMDEYGGFDLVIGGSPCNNISGANRVSRIGLEGAESSLFFEYSRVLEAVRCKAARMRR
ncbi:unnamed protein product [Thlaspi arvense]|uniref:DNA (cytosine-5-)-methyltransferase n=1 Tax=Thlaspi arvense TaxID=13288 RepID=A0AAU9RV63_THLAR|nr:unnamed protein product [Thlaspi arvense]